MTRDHQRGAKAETFCVSVGLAAMVAAVLASTGQDSPRIELREARRHVGKNVMVCGTVTTHHCPRPKRTTYLDLETAYWSEGVSVAIHAASRQAFGLRVEDRYALRTVCASGRVEREGKRHVVNVSQPSDLSIQREPQPPPVLLDPAGVRGCDDGVELPRPIKTVKPRYPANARATGREGIVLLDGVVRIDGSVGDVVVVHSPDSASGMDDEAVKAFQQWRFTPGTVAGRPTAVIVGVELTFHLK